MLSLCWSDFEPSFLREFIIETFPCFNFSNASDEHCLHLLNKSRLSPDSVTLSVSQRHSLYPDIDFTVQSVKQIVYDEILEANKAEEVHVAAEKFGLPGLGREAQNVADASSKFTAQAVNEQ